MVCNADKTTPSLGEWSVVGEAAYQLSCSSAATALTSNQPRSIPAGSKGTSFKTTHLSRLSIRTQNYPSTQNINITVTMARPRGPFVSLPPALLPSNKTVLTGRTITLEKLQPKHAKDLFNLVGGEEPAKTSLWDYMGDGPYAHLEEFERNIAARSASLDPFFFAIIDKRSSVPTSGKPIGYLTLMRITPEQWTVEIGNVMLSAAVQRTTGATEAFYLLARHAFEDLNYRRFEWKCDSLNSPSRKAALRLGFTFEGIFRQHMVVKGRNRDTAWFSIVRDEWDSGVKYAMEKWLDGENFDENGNQKKALQDYKLGSTAN